MCTRRSHTQPHRRGLQTAGFPSAMWQVQTGCCEFRAPYLKNWLGVQLFRGRAGGGRGRQSSYCRGVIEILRDNPLNDVFKVLRDNLNVSSSPTTTLEIPKFFGSKHRICVEFLSKYPYCEHIAFLSLVHA